MVHDVTQAEPPARPKHYQLEDRVKKETKKSLSKIIQTYETVLGVMEHGAERAVAEKGRAYGGFVRAQKGQLQEYITEELIRVAWEQEMGREPARLDINKRKIRIPIQISYVEKIKDKSIREHILLNLRSYSYGLSVDKHVFVDGVFVMGIECKAYTENAMIKRILVDFMLLKTHAKDLICFLFQLESQLTGDYSTATLNPFGSGSTHTLMSYFPTVDLKIVTLLEGERSPSQPINKTEHYKELQIGRLEAAVAALTDGFSRVGNT